MSGSARKFTMRKGAVNDDGLTLRLEMLLNKLSESLEGSNASKEALAYLEEAKQVVNTHDKYLEDMSSEGPDIIKPMIQATIDADWEKLHKDGKTQYPVHAEMCSGMYEPALLEMLLSLCGGKQCLEIGMFTGTTAVTMALVPGVEKVVTLDIEPYLVEFNTPFWKQAGVADKIDCRIGDGLKTLKDLQEAGEKFDFVFIDANKDGYTDYYKALFANNLLTEDALIVADNTLYKAASFARESLVLTDPKVIGWAKDIDAFNKHVKEDENVDVIVMSVRDGVSLIRKKGTTSGR